jgi:hypothetical protein
MTLQTQIYHPKLIIAGHFDEKISQFENKTEFLLLNQSLQTELPGKIKDLRDKQIAEIKELKELNLNLLAQPFNQEEFRLNWSHVIEDNSLETKHKIDKIKVELILNDCVLLPNSKQTNGFDLWITSWFNNEMNLEFLK